MKVWPSILGALGSLALAGCGDDILVAKPQPMSITLSHQDRLDFHDFLTSMGALAQKTQVVISHSNLPSPLFIASGELAQRWAGGGDPVILQIENTGLHLDGTKITHSKFAARLKEFAELTKMTETVAIIVVVSANDVPFADGIEALRTLVRSGIDHIIVLAPHKPSDPSQQKTRRKPTRPSRSPSHSER